MHNTISDIALTMPTNDSRETNYFHNFSAVSKINVLRLSFASGMTVLGMLFNFGHFSAPQCSQAVVVNVDRFYKSIWGQLPLEIRQSDYKALMNVISQFFAP